MDTPTHAVQGGLLFGLPTKLVANMAQMPQDATIVIVSIMFALGAISGAWPDLAVWLRHKIDKCPRWAWWSYYHDPPAPQPWTSNPAYLLHLYVDKPFHTPDGNWWPRKRNLAIFLWILTALLTAGLVL